MALLISLEPYAYAVKRHEVVWRVFGGAENTDDGDEYFIPARVKIVLTSTGERRALLGRGSIREPAYATRLAAVRLTRAGRRIVQRRGGARVRIAILYTDKYGLHNYTAWQTHIRRAP